MNVTEAHNTAQKLFGENVTVFRGKHKCFVLRNGEPIGDGRGWLEALRSAGSMEIVKQTAKEADDLKVMLEKFRAAYPTINPEKQLTKEELEIFDAWVEKYQEGKP